MKNKLAVCSVCLLMSLSVSFSGCGQEKEVCEVSFDGNYSGCKTYGSRTVSSGEKLEEPEEPVREGYHFLGWFQDVSLTQAWDFSKDKVKEELTLYAGWDMDTGDKIEYPEDDKDFSKLRTPGSQEAAYTYRTFFLPEADGATQPYVGDTMPYYEDGVFYIYYLKDGGDSFNHSVYLATTTDFVSYAEQDEPVLEASREGGQDAWIGTGSVVKVEETYYFFYTGHTSLAAAEFKEKIMVAKGGSPTSFEKIADWEIEPPESLNQKNDFRDPQAYYDPETGKISLTVTASKDNVARILKYTLSADLQEVEYDGIIFSNEVGNFWNLECSDTFRLGDLWYLTYSAQDDTLWYASSKERYGPYSPAKRLEGKLFYAAKHVEDGDGNIYMADWARRSESVSSTQDVSAWAGNLLVQKVCRREDGDLYLVPVEAVAGQFDTRRELLIDGTNTFIEAGALYSYKEVFTCYERFLLSGEFRFFGEGSFGLCFDFNGRGEKYKMISICPSENKVQLTFNEGSVPIAETEVFLEAGKDYSFTYIQEGSVGTFYIDGLAALTVRLYGVSGKPVRLFAENNSVIFTSLREMSGKGIK